MREIKIKINDLVGAAEFVEILEKVDVRGNLTLGRYCLDARSLMGILSMDLKQPLQLTISDDEKADELLVAVDKFVMN